MFISSEHWDEEVFPLGYFIVFSLYKDLADYEKINPLKLKTAGFFSIEREVSNRRSNGRLKQNESKYIEKSVRDVCRLNGYHLRTVKIINGQILMVISNQSNPKINFNLPRSGMELKSFSLKILSKAEALGKLENFCCLWKNGQIDAAIDYVKNGKGKLEFDLQ